MKVLFALDFSPFKADKDGITLILYHFIKGISEKTDCDLLLCGPDAKAPVENPFPKLRSLFFEPSPPGSRLGNILHGNYPNILDKRPITQLFEKYNMADYDIIHTSYLSFLPLANHHPGLIVGITDSLSKAISGLSPVQMLKRFFYRQLEHKISRSNAWLICVTETDAKDYSTDKIAVISNGVDTNKYHPLETEKQAGFCFHGNLDYGPNIAAIQTMSQTLAKLGPNHTLHLIGRCQKESTKSIYRRLPNTNLIGEVANIADAIGQFDAYLILMDSASGIKNKLLEALSCGSVILANENALNGVTLTNELKETLYLINAPEDINAALRDRNNWDTKRKAARNFAMKHLSWETQIQSLLAYYNHIIGPSPRS